VLLLVNLLQAHSSTDRFNRDQFSLVSTSAKICWRTFRIKNFVSIKLSNCTLSGEDVFVLNGRWEKSHLSITSAFEGWGRSQSGRVTFVISPTTELDQRSRKINEYLCTGSALASPASWPGGQTVRSGGIWSGSQQGVCLVLVTPEMVSKIKQIKNRMKCKETLPAESVRTIRSG
jgi:hypothetical protein